MPRRMTADELRWLAEEADGRRDEELAIVWSDEEKKHVLLPVNDSRSKTAQVTLYTDYEGEGLRGGEDICLVHAGKRVPMPSGPAVDAYFLTQSAVEKFVLPYYTRMQSPWQIGDLRVKLFKKGVIAAMHVPPSLTSPYLPKLHPVIASEIGEPYIEDAVVLSEPSEMPDAT